MEHWLREDSGRWLMKMRKKHLLHPEKTGEKRFYWTIKSFFSGLFWMQSLYNPKKHLSKPCSLGYSWLSFVDKIAELRDGWVVLLETWLMLIKKQILFKIIEYPGKKQLLHCTCNTGCQRSWPAAGWISLVLLAPPPPPPLKIGFNCFPPSGTCCSLVKH